MSRLRRGVGLVGIYYSRVMAVQPDAYTVDATSEYLGQQFFRIPYAALYAHHANGEGTYHIPEVGAWCWVCVPSDHNRPFVMCFIPPFSLIDDNRSNRLKLIPGDQAMVSRELNGIIVRRGGVTQISATPVCQRIYSPIANRIRDICENYELTTGGGTLTWTVSRQAANEKAQSPTVLVLEAKEFAQEDPKIVIKIGSSGIPKSAPAKGPSIPAGKKVYIDVEVKDQFRYRANLDGDSLLFQSGDRSLRVEGKEIHFVDGDRELQIGGKLTETVTGDVLKKYKGNSTINVTGTSKETANKKVIESQKVFLGSEAGAVATILGPIFADWAFNHFHNVTAVGAPSGPAMPRLSKNTVLTKRVKVT